MLVSAAPAAAAAAATSINTQFATAASLMPDMSILTSMPPASLAAGAAFILLLGSALTRQQLAHDTQLQIELAEMKERIDARIAALRPLERRFFRITATGNGKGGGLFATKDIPSGTFLFDYRGEVLDTDQFDHRYPDGVPADYVVQVGDQYIDAADPSRSNIARKMNHSRQPNCICWTLNGLQEVKPRVLFFTAENVDQGSELTWNYGDGYWRDRPRGSELP